VPRPGHSGAPVPCAPSEYCPRGRASPLGRYTHIGTTERPQPEVRLRNVTCGRRSGFRVPPSRLVSLYRWREAQSCHHVWMRFTATAQDGGRGRVLIPVPFDPNEVWNVKPRHHVGGTINGHRIRGVIARHDQLWGLLLGRMCVDGSGVAAGDQVELDIEAEGPQRSDLPSDVAAALAGNPRAGECFDGLAQFYRRGYLRWIDATKRDPAERIRRITQTVDLLAAGVKDYRRR
jgi:hypothetical protein